MKVKMPTVKPVDFEFRAGWGHYRTVRIPRGLSSRQVKKAMRRAYRVGVLSVPRAQRIADANPQIWFDGLRRSDFRKVERGAFLLTRV